MVCSISGIAPSGSISPPTISRRKNTTYKRLIAAVGAAQRKKYASITVADKALSNYQNYIFLNSLQLRYNQRSDMGISKRVRRIYNNEE